jgi:hypothetical protein
VDRAQCGFDGDGGLGGTHAISGYLQPVMNLRSFA